MLFQRLYNWIKYKTLPPSVLFKNRLFIERDSKHKRIFSNFGLTFRNSKWSNYAVYNIKSQFKNSFLFVFFFFLFFFFFFLFFFFFFFFIWNYSESYLIQYAFNNVSFLFWLCVDSFDYYSSFFVWCILFTMSFTWHVLYNFFFYTNFSDTRKTSDIFSNKFFVESRGIFSRKSDIILKSKHDFNWVLYSWLTNTKIQTNTLILETIFEHNLNKNFWNEYYDFFIKLYKVTFLCNLSLEKNSIYAINVLLNKLLNKNYKGNYFQLAAFLNNSNKLTASSSLIMYQILNNFTNHFDSLLKRNSSIFFLNTRSEWNTLLFLRELTEYGYITFSKSGVFFFNDLNYGLINSFLLKYPELNFLPSSLNQQLNSAKWNRWLYRYSILHRKILKNSHKLTLSKKLLNSGFYNSSLFEKNVWASTNFFKYDKNDIMGSFYNLYYDNAYQQSFPLITSSIYEKINFNNRFNLQLLNFYETSYFWFLKRYYFFNSLPSNLVKSTLNIKISEKKINFLLLQNSEYTKYSSTLTYLLNSSLLTYKNFAHFNNSYSNGSYPLYSVFHNSFTNYNVKDTYNLFQDFDLLDKENLNLLYWISSSSSSFNNTLNYFSYLKINKNCLNNFDSTYSPTNVSFQSAKNFDNFLYASLNNIDFFFLNDIEFLTFL